MFKRCLDRTLFVIFGFKDFGPAHSTNALLISTILAIMGSDLMNFCSANLTLFKVVTGGVGIETVLFGTQKLVFVDFST